MRTSELLIRFTILFMLCRILPVQAQEVVAELNSNWRFRKVGDSAWLPATVPGTVYTDLFANKKIPDPFFGDNEKSMQWIDTCDWEYEIWFNADAETIKNNHCELSFEGLDTYAKVFLNDSLLVSADNMFRTWDLECKKYLKPENNHLVILFESAVKKGKALARKKPYTLPGEEKVYTRKAQYQYGWDWAPRFAGCGIWRPVKFKTWNGFKINNIQVTNGEIKDSIVSMHARVSITTAQPSYLYLKITVDGASPDSFYFEPLITHPEEELVDVDFKIRNPVRWWSNETGDPVRYNISFRVMNTQREQEIKTVSYGLRKIELVRKADRDGSSFYFKVNGLPVFMKGANWVPADHFLPRMTKEKYRELLLAAKEAHMNMLRVWGGGIYEDDAFYDLCDSLGILVWQDFMFACSMYPGDKAFISNVKEEINQNVKRLRNHPCIALWCGNNEIDEGWKNWGWQKQFNYSKKDSAELWNDYQELFHRTLPSVLAKLDSSRAYWESSPSIGWGHKESLQKGDSHYWGVWWGMEPFENYKKKVGRFMSEYGFQGMPSFQTIASFTDPAERNSGSSQIKNHQKHPTGYETIGHYMEEWYRTPKDFESYAYVSQLLQAECVGTAIEAHRRAKPYCMGSLYWQLNDCWPVTSWSSIDYYGRWKALHYAAREAFGKYLISVDDTGSFFGIYVTSDDTAPAKAVLKIITEDFSGHILRSDSTVAYISNEHATLAYKTKAEDITFAINPSSTFLRMELVQNQKILARKIYYFAKPKDLLLIKPEINFSIQESRGELFISLSTAVLAKNVFLEIKDEDIHFSENYFDLLPGETKTVSFHSQRNADELRKKLVIRSLSDSY